MSKSKKLKAGASANEAHILRHRKFGMTPIDDINVDESNTRDHPGRQNGLLLENMKSSGWTRPIEIDENNRILSGHLRLLVAKKLGLSVVPTLKIEGLTEQQKRAYRIFDNRISDLGRFDTVRLTGELKLLSEDDSVSHLTGFSPAEIDQLILGSEDQAEPDAKANALPAANRDLQPGSTESDCYIMGRHRLLCADARSQSSYERLLGGKTAQMVLSDPPFNTAVRDISGLGAVKHPEFAMASGEMTEAQYISFLTRVLRCMTRAARNGALLYIFIDWRHVRELLIAARQLDLELKNICVWNKSNGGMGSHYRSKHEFVVVLKAGSAPHINNIELGRNGRYRTNVWDYAGVNTFGAARADELAMHPTVKPVELLADAILDATKRGGIVLDPFAGSGSLIIAAERVGRRAFCIELDPHYADICVKRWQTYTGQHAIHEDSGLTFDDLCEQRRVPPLSDVRPKSRSGAGRPRTTRG